MTNATGNPQSEQLLPGFDVIPNTIIMLGIEKMRPAVLLHLDKIREAVKAAGGIYCGDYNKPLSQRSSVMDLPDPDTLDYPIVVVTTTRDNYSRLEMLADLSFFYVEGLRRSIIHRGKYRTVEITMPHAMVLPEPHSSTTSTDNAIQINVTGTLPQSGKSSLVEWLLEKLREELVGSGITVAVASSESRIHRSGSLADSLKCGTVQIVDMNMKPIPYERMTKECVLVTYNTDRV